MLVDPEKISQNCAAILERLTQAAKRSGRSLADITLVAVTKNVPVESLGKAWAFGLRHFGENRVQEAERKKSDFAARFGDTPGLTWHLLGHLQSNKAKKAAALFDRFQSLDSFPLAERLNKEGLSLGRPLRCLVEVKISDEPTKQGVAPQDVDDFLARLAPLEFIRVDGLMTIAPYLDDPRAGRPYFQRMRSLFDRNRPRFKTEAPVLSMGMSHDFETAVEEGATMVRIGTAIFGERPRPEKA
ncbi:MAG TPA: YggS family pyridoxal phosphate-dependent enzyme [Elusimicrobiota bacterium]|nr:YggS family pyridoxal phosphate-dependent enzyme [Elusimicrobiota bacterium]